MTLLRKMQCVFYGCFYLFFQCFFFFYLLHVGQRTNLDLVSSVQTNVPSDQVSAAQAQSHSFPLSELNPQSTASSAEQSPERSEGEFLHSNKEEKTAKELMVMSILSQCHPVLHASVVCLQFKARKTCFPE